MHTTTSFLLITVLVPIAVLLVVTAVYFVVASIHAWRTYRGVHVIRCPETRKPAAVPRRHGPCRDERDQG